MDTKIVGTSSVLSIEDVIDESVIMVGDHLEWLTLLLEPKKRICSSFNDCVIPFYECMFKII